MGHGAAHGSHAHAAMPTCAPLVHHGLVSLTAAKLKAHELRGKGKQELLKQLDGLKAELAMVRRRCSATRTMDGAHAYRALVVLLAAACRQGDWRCRFQAG